MAAVTSARADIASQAYVDQQDEAIEAKITTLNANASTEGSVAYKIAQSITSTYDGTDESKAVTGKAVASAISDVTSTANSAIKGVKVNGSALTPTEGIVDKTAKKRRFL